MQSATRRRLLLIAFHFPPVQGSTGVHRSLAFARHLTEMGWDVTVLTATPGAYPETSPENGNQVPESVRVVRALALDAQRHLSMFGRYPSALARPDRWRSWIYTGFRVGRRLIREWRPDAIFSTFPIPSAHEIGVRLADFSGLPWIADFRDPMAQERYPQDEALRRAYWDLETRVMNACAAATVTTEGAAGDLRRRYPRFPDERIRVIPNGFDEHAFSSLAAAAPTARRADGAVRVLHSGILYPKERNPDCFFQALAELRAERRLGPENLRVDLRGCGFADRYQPQLERLGLSDMVRVLPSLPYREALREMCEADALALFQASNCNNQIPAKLYEYLYIGRPVLGLTDRAGDTGRLLNQLGIANVASLEDVSEIKTLLLRAVAEIRQGTAFVPPRQSIMRFSRRGSAESLARLLDEVTSSSSRGESRT